MQLIDPKKLSLKIEKGESITVLDIRESYEHEICSINAKHIPMGELTARLSEISKDDKLVVMCKTGKRAEATANLLEADYNFSKVYVLEGGIINWIEQVAPNLESY